MQDYYGTKRVTAWPKIGKDYKEGYAVKYADDYISWSPKKVFEAAYKPVTAMDFSGALAAMRDGHKVKRKDWPYGSYLFISMTGEPINWVRNLDYDPELWPEDDEVIFDLIAEDWTITIPTETDTEENTEDE